MLADVIKKVVKTDRQRIIVDYLKSRDGTSGRRA